MENEVKEITVQKKDSDEISEESLKKINAPISTLPPDIMFENLLEKIGEHRPGENLDLVKEAYRVARDAHGLQLRKSGEPYIIHPIAVADILTELEMDTDTIVAALLHDVVEDTDVSLDDIKNEFGEEIAGLVDGVTKLTKIKYTADKVEVQAENLRKMFLAMSNDIRVIIIKLADRLHNMRTLQHLPRYKQIEKARETMEIYAPIAGRLGISRIKTELDDLALKYTDPDTYYTLVEGLEARNASTDDFIVEMVSQVREDMKGAEIECEVEGRVKHIFSIYKKMVNQNKSLDQIYDLFAVRIKVETVKDCYAALGVLHEIYKPIPGRFKDYIAMPKANLYQSLHTTLISRSGAPFEVQIRTYEMDYTAEYGIAAHWKYKEGKSADDKTFKPVEDEKLSWLKQIIDWQQGEPDNKEYLDFLKSDLDLFNDDVFCFTPQGDVKSLPAGSTTIDFAYSIHSAVGNKMVGARVNGKIVNIDYRLQNGDRVEIITSQNSRGPSRDWLNIVKSPQARSKINQWFRNANKEDNIAKGREQIDRYIKAKGIDIPELFNQKYVDAVLNKYSQKNWDSLLATVGHGGLKEGQVVNRLYEEYKKDKQAEVTDQEILDAVTENPQKDQPGSSKASSGITVRGIHDVAVKFAKCCSPVPGDDIVGFVTRGRGVTIHRTDCVNIINLSSLDRARLIDAQWDKPQSAFKNEKYSVEISMFADNRTGLVVDISKIMSERNLDVTTMNVRVNKQQIATIDLGFQVSSKDELSKVVEKLQQIDGVRDITRTRG